MALTLYQRLSCWLGQVCCTPLTLASGVQSGVFGKHCHNITSCLECIQVVFGLGFLPLCEVLTAQTDLVTGSGPPFKAIRLSDH
jgi:hypothetical protein